MILENTTFNKAIKEVAATMAVEDMQLSNEFIEQLAATNGDDAKLEALRQEVIKEHMQPKPEEDTNP
jgi:hypothetical protein